MKNQQPPKAPRSIEELIAESERLEESARLITDRINEVAKELKERTEESQKEQLRITGKESS
jgi:uncharacterized protein (UPF0335 family)